MEVRHKRGRGEFKRVLNEEQKELNVELIVVMIGKQGLGQLGKLGRVDQERRVKQEIGNKSQDQEEDDEDLRKQMQRKVQESAEWRISRSGN